MSAARSAPSLDHLDAHARAAEAALSRARRRLAVLERELIFMAPFLAPTVARRWSTWSARTARTLEAEARAARAAEAWLLSYEGESAGTVAAGGAP
jgi:hypothetical protein